MSIGPIEAAQVRQQFACLYHQNGPQKLELFIVSALATYCMKAGLSFLRCYQVAWVNASSSTRFFEDDTWRY
jgi:hypothetical protein